MQFLAEELSDPSAKPCGRCASCIGELLPEGYPDDVVRAAMEFLDRLENPILPRKKWPPGLTDPGMRGNVRAELQAQEGRALCRWGDPGLGALVRRGKRQDHRFNDQLVDAAARLIKDRWRPEPKPAWVTCVPSKRHPALVPDFARRLAGRLGLPFVECIRKVKDIEPQKTRVNSFQRTQNLLAVSQLMEQWADRSRYS